MDVTCCLYGLPIKNVTHFCFKSSDIFHSSTIGKASIANSAQTFSLIHNIGFHAKFRVSVCHRNLS